MLDHMEIQCSDLAASAAFYEAVLPAIGGARIMEFDVAIGYGIPPMPCFWIGEHRTNYYGAFVRDPDGNNVEAVCHSPE